MPQLEHITAIEKRLWETADKLRANSSYASNEYFLPVKHLPREKLAKVEINIPPVALVERFVEHVAPIEAPIDVLQTGVARASQARDLLLPRLMNEEIPV